MATAKTASESGGSSGAAGSNNIGANMSGTRKGKPRTWGKGDRAAPPMEALDWNAQSGESSLAVVFNHVRRDALDAISWYSRAKRPKRRIATWARFLALVAVGVAAILPLLDGALPDSILPGQVSSLWVSLAIAIGGGALSIDRFMGASSGWVRYVKTELQIRNLLEAFELDWEEGRAARMGRDPKPEEIADMLGKARTFAGQINAIVQEETQAWVEEFQGSVKQIEDVLKTRADEAQARKSRNEPGALNLTVTNGEQCAAGWLLQVDDLPETAHLGQTAAIPQVTPGRRRLRVQGDIAGARVRAERMVDIPPNSAANAEVTLA